MSINVNKPSANKVAQLQQLFERSADNYPSHIALVCNNEQFSYFELERRANQLAHYLQGLGLTEKNVIGVLLERSLDSYIGLLAILKIGATYVPIEVDYPNERINYIFSDMTFHAVLTSSSQRRRDGLRFPKVVVLDEINSRLSTQPTHRPLLSKEALQPDQVCYVIYTSGSTGKPKGVEITHQSICHYVAVASELYNMTPQDRVYQGFSLAFDASFEEIGMALANGAALIACTSKAIRSGDGLIDFLRQHRVSFFSTVPTLLSTLEGTLSDLRILILGGEVCSAHLVNRWYRKGLQIFNTYGPTEATVIATYSECMPNVPVTIGRPLPGYEVLILDENLHPVPEGCEGELCIGGLGLAKGYVNRPEFTNTKFVFNPQDNTQRLYRTGDLAKKTASGDIHYLGRVDSQIKLRGFRIELNEIEAVMMEYGVINQAVVALQQLESPTLVAYLQIDKNRVFDLAHFKRFLHEKLPHYMIPAFYEWVDAFPLLPSGKVDRKGLPNPTQTAERKEYTAPSTKMEKIMAEVWETVMQTGPISTVADFFYDLGGHSLLAAKVVSSLRQHPDVQTISILDIYQNPSIQQLALKFSKPPVNSHVRQTKQKRARNTTPAWMYYLCGVGQFLGCLLQYAVSAWQLLAVIICYSWVTEHRSFVSWESTAIFFSIFMLMPIVSLSFTIGTKWLLLGRVKPGHYRLWGWFYLRWWLVERLQKNVFSPKHLIGSPLIILYYRLLGAKIGKNCYIGSLHLSIQDMISIGDNTSIGYDTSLTGYIVEDGWLKIGSISIGNHCFIGGRSRINIDTVMEDGAALGHMSMLPEEAVIPKGQYFSGSPACLSILPPDHVIKHKNPAIEQSARKNLLYGIYHYLCLIFAMVVHYSCYIPCIALISYSYEHSHYLTTIFFAAPIGAIVFMLLYAMGLYLSKKIILRQLKPGTYALKSFCYLRQWTIVKMLDIDEIGVMADSLYLPLFLRLLGAKIGKMVEMGEAPHVIPDMVSIEDEGFAASSVALAWPDVYNGFVRCAPINIGKRGFVGNGSLLPSGAEIGDGTLLGCMSITPSNNQAAKADTAWLGSPAVFLPKRELFTGFSDEETFNPPKRLYRQRLAIELARIIMPTTFSLILLFNMLYVLDFLMGNFSLLTTFLVLPMVEMGMTLGIVAVIIAMKWVMLGKMKPSVTPIWNSYIWKNDIREYLYSYFTNRHLTDIIIGTPFIAILFRCMGATIGKRFFTDTNLFAEFDLISIGDNVCINSETRIQTHLYEDRIFKLSNLVIHDDCNVGDASIVLYDTVMEKNSTLGSLSLLMKGERLPENTRWEGIPAQSTVFQAQSEDLLQSMLNNNKIEGNANVDVSELA